MAAKWSSLSGWVVLLSRLDAWHCVMLVYQISTLMLFAALRHARTQMSCNGSGALPASCLLPACCIRANHCPLSPTRLSSGAHEQ